MELCKKCKKELPEGALYCPFCGAPQKKNPRKKMYQRPDGLFEKILTIDGKRKAFRGKTEAAVIQQIAAYQSKAEAGASFGDVADDWWGSFVQKYRGADGNGTLRSYAPCFQRAVEWFEDRPIAEITSQEVQHKVDHFAEGHALTTVTNQICILNHIFKHAILTDQFPAEKRNPCEYIRAPKKLKRGRRNPPTEEQVRKVSAFMADPERVAAFPGALLALTFLYTGLRFGEALALRQQDVDRENGVIHVRGSVTFTGNTPTVKAPKTQAGVRIVAAPPLLIQLLPKGKPGSFVFSGGPDPMTLAQYNGAWLAFCKEIGEVERKTFQAGKRAGHTHLAPTITAHQFRHEYASLLYRLDVGVKEAQSLLGHAQAATTQDTYTHIRESQRAELLSSVSRKLQDELIHSYTDATQDRR